MAETIGIIACPECEQVAELRQDKRKKLFISCSECGRFMYNTNAGQERLRARFESADQERTAQEIADAIAGLVTSDRDPADVDAIIHTDEGAVIVESKKERGKVGGLVALGVGMVLGFITWQRNQGSRNQQATNRTTIKNPPGMM